MGGGVFEYCKKLTSITIPASVKSVGYYLFNECGSLSVVNIEGNTEDIARDSTFAKTKLSELYTPSISISEFDKPAIKLKAAMYYINLSSEGRYYKEEVIEANKKYISKNKDKLIQTAPDDVVIIRYITDNKLLKLADVDRYLEEGILSVEAKVLLLQYRENNFTDKQKIADFEKL